jgi:hypothetical protein
MSRLVTFLDPICTSSILAIDLKLVAMSVGRLKNPGIKDQTWKVITLKVFCPIFSASWPDIWDLARHLSAKGRYYSEKNASSLWQIFFLKTGKSQND